MKSLKNMFFIFFVAIASFTLMGISKVNAALMGFTLQPPICNPNELDPGESAKCFLIGTASQAGPTHGFAIRLYTTDGLLFDDATVKSINGLTSQVILKASANSGGVTGNLKINGEDKPVTCNYDTNISIVDSSQTNKEAWMIEDGDDFRCVYFYSTNTEGVFTPTATAITDTEKSQIGQSNVSASLLLIGTVDVHLDEKISNASGCGELCVAAIEKSDANAYAVGADAAAPGYFCSEVHYDVGGVAGVPNTGAFASYAVLAAGVLVAISAIAIAKKHNKIYRV